MLNGKQKRYLRGLSNKLKTDVMVGKEGLSETIVETLNKALEAHELVKVSVLKSCELDFNELTLDLLSASNSDLVQTLGKTIVLYRLSKERKIILP